MAPPPYLSAGWRSGSMAVVRYRFAHLRPFDDDMVGIGLSMLYEYRLALGNGLMQCPKCPGKRKPRGVSPPGTEIRVPQGVPIGVLGNLAPQVIPTDGSSTPASNRQAVFFKA